MTVPSLARSFRHPGVAEAYAYRPPYPPGVFAVLDGLLIEAPVPSWTSGGYLAIVDQRYHDLPWRTPVPEVIARHSRDPDCDPGFSLPGELSRRNLFRGVGAHETPPIEFVQSTMDYIEQFHSTASLARELMSPAEADRFDAEVAAVVREYQDYDGMLTPRTVGTIAWGRPVPAAL